MRNKEELLPTFLYYLQKRMINGENCIVRKSHFIEVIYSFPKGCINAFKFELKL